MSVGGWAASIVACDVWVLAALPNEALIFIIAVLGAFGAFVYVNALLSALTYIAEKDYDRPSAAGRQGIEQRCGELRKRFLSFFSLTALTVLLGVFGFFERGFWSAARGVSFSVTNSIENVACIALLWLPTLVGSFVLLVTSLNYLEEVAVGLRRYREDPKSYDSKAGERWKELSRLLSEERDCVSRSLRGRGDCRDFGASLRRVRSFGVNQKANLFLQILWPALWIGLFVAMLLVIVLATERASVDKWLPFTLMFAGAFGILYPLFGATLAIWMQVSDSRNPSAFALVALVLPLVFGKYSTFDFRLLEKIPQQFGGFRPEEYVATWKEPKGRETIPEGYKETRLGSERQAAIQVVYKTEKYLFLKPCRMPSSPGPEPPEWKAVMVSTDGMESLVPPRPVPEPTKR